MGVRRSNGGATKSEQKMMQCCKSVEGWRGESGWKVARGCCNLLDPWNGMEGPLCNLDWNRTIAKCEDLDKKLQQRRYGLK